MVTYKLVAETVFDNKRIILEEKKLPLLDAFIYRGFSSIPEMSDYFDIPASNFYIKYVYDKKLKNMDIILNDGNDDFASLLYSSKNNKIDTDSLSFVNIMSEFYYLVNNKKLRFLFEHNYIDRKSYNDIYAYLNMSRNSYDYNRDRNDLRYEIKRSLSHYINFRKFYSGLKRLQEGVVSEFVPQKRVAKTDNDLLNSCFNTGGLDMVYSNFDLDEISLIEGADSLGIDGISYTKKR